MGVFLPLGIITRPLRKATVITDASYCQDSLAGGWAAWVKLDGGGSVKRGGILPQPASSTEAEVMAAANGCYLAAREGATHILLQSDCMAVIHLVHGQTRSESLLRIWRSFLAYEAMQGVQITARHVKGHGRIHDARTWVNDWCDRHAYQYMDQARAKHRAAAGKSRRQNRSTAGGAEKGPRPLGGLCPRP